MDAAKLLTVAAVCALASAGTAAAHSVPTKWWLDEATAFRRLEAKERAGRTLSSFTGRCRGLAPRATVGGRAVFKHFSCSARVRASGVTMSFFYRMHVAGPNGRIVLGG